MQPRAGKLRGKVSSDWKFYLRPACFI